MGTKLKCVKCGNIIEGDKKGTFITCCCNAIYIDETPYYCRIGGNIEDILILKDNVWTTLPRDEGKNIKTKFHIGDEVFAILSAQNKRQLFDSWEVIMGEIKQINIEEDRISYTLTILNGGGEISEIPENNIVKTENSGEIGRKIIEILGGKK